MATSGNAPLTEATIIRQRGEFFDAFASTMVNIWKERIALLKVIDTGFLYSSVVTAFQKSDAEKTYVEYHFRFAEYGIYLQRGTGRETPRGNPGDIGRPKVREKRPWFQPKYAASVHNLKDFMCETLGQEFVSVIDSTLGRTFAPPP